MHQFCFKKTLPKTSMPILDKMTQIDAKLSAIVAYILCTFTQDFQELMHYIFAMYDLTSIELRWATESALA